MKLAIINPGSTRARFFLLLRSYLQPDVQCFYYSKRRTVRAWIKSAGCQPYPRRHAASQMDLSDEELRVAIGRKELELRAQTALKSARGALNELAEFFDACQPDAVLLWNGSNLTLSLAAHLARRRRIPVVFAENGYLPGTLQLDREGVNYASSLTSAVQRGDAQLPPDPKLDAALQEEIACHKSGRPPRPKHESPPGSFRSDLISRTKYYWRARTRKWRDERVWREGRALGLDSAAPLPERFLLVPLQVRNDSQLILHSPLVGNDLRRLLGMVQHAAAQIDPNLRIIAKLHPREQPRIQKRNLELLREFPGIRFVCKAPIRDLLSRATAVVTINSTVGFEAMLYDKPVVTLGCNFYTAPHLVEVVEAEHELKDALIRALSKPVPVERRQAFLRYVYSRFLVQGSYGDYSDRSLRAVADRICELLGLRPRNAMLTAPPAARDHEHVRGVGATRGAFG